MHYLRERSGLLCLNCLWAHSFGYMHFCLVSSSQSSPTSSLSDLEFWCIYVSFHSVKWSRIVVWRVMISPTKNFCLWNSSKKRIEVELSENILFPLKSAEGWLFILSGVRIFSVRLLYQTHAEVLLNWEWVEHHLNLLNWALEIHYLIIYLYLHDPEEQN